MGSLIYTDGSLKTIQHDEGRVHFDASQAAHYQFFIADHLGNTRVIIERLNGTTALVQETHYGAWGEVLKGIGVTGDWDFLYQGKEYVDAFGYNNYDFHSRSYDPYSGRFNQIDGANQFASGYTGMGNNPVSLVDPDGQFAFVPIVAAAALLFTNTGFEIQKYLSPVALHFNFHMGSDIKGFGADISIGIPKAFPYSSRQHYGATYYSRYYDNSFSGWEKRSGGEITIAGFLNYSGTKFTSGETSQTLNKITIGIPFANVQYENDFMFDWAKYFPGASSSIPLADKGDRFRTTGAQINVGVFKIGLNMFTGDPGLKGGTNGDRIDFNDPEVTTKAYPGGRPTYTTGKNGDNPDKYRHASLYFGIGPFRFGRNSENIRNTFQNKLAHDGQDVPYFKVLPERKPKWFWYFGTGFGGSLW